MVKLEPHGPLLHLTLLEGERFRSRVCLSHECDDSFWKFLRYLKIRESCFKELFSTRTDWEVPKPLSTAAARAWWVTNHQRGGWQQHWDLQTTRTRGCRSSVRPRSSVTSLTCPHRSRRVTDRRTGGGWGWPPLRAVFTSCPSLDSDSEIGWIWHV